ncbi:MAG TPA: tRNA uridine-5-carboxymethylaminomethyl(34) synthesis GTPase MnmE [Stellaceae bacterium]|nr:tRNA uridine-5-carboxymethylaminomethyl(34) synthesis GTPase MnmE [Stellaceae bacterium]
MNDTIFALSTAAGRAGIAVLRLSGPKARSALQELAGRLPPPRRASLARFRDPASGEAIDQGLMLLFPAPHSVTGEDVAELQVHGSRAVTAALLDSLGRMPGLRLAEPGEFARRAFLNDKLDLTEVEGLADLIAAETAAQRRQALRQLGGELGRLCEGWRQRLLAIQARLEAAIDFPEEDLPSGLLDKAGAEAARLATEIEAHLVDARRGERLRDGIAVAILGPPNAGKSSLMNALARRDVAITSAIAGTTRDVIEVALDLAGYPVVLADTAGVRAARDAIEEEGVRRARARAASADLKLVLLDATQPEPEEALRALIDEDALVIANKIDLLPEGDMPPAGMVPLSVKTGAGMGDLLARLTAAVAERLAPGNAAVVTRARHRRALEDCVAALARFARAPLPELAAEDLRRAVRALGRITGRVDVEDMLDMLFREFCIGK